MTRVAVLGLGAMGLPMATRLVEQGFDVRAFDVSPERLALARAAGAVPGTSPAEACRDAEIALVGVRDARQLEQALFGPDGATVGLAAGAVVVLTSTVGADAARDAADRLAATGVGLVDSPVSGSSVRAAKGDLLLMVSGAEEAVAAARPVLAALASTLTTAGPRVGDGQLLKTVNQLICGVHTAVAAEALTLAHALGLDLDATIDVLGRGAAASFMLADRGPRIAERLRGGVPELRSRLDVISKDMGIVGSLTRQTRVPTPVAAAAEQLYRLGEARGLGAEDDSVIATVLAGTRVPDPLATPGEGA